MIATTSRPAAAAAGAGRLDLTALLARPYPAVMGVLGLLALTIFIAAGVYLWRNEHRLQEAAEAALPGPLRS
jgi:hypothetical protein